MCSGSCFYKDLPKHIQNKNIVILVLYVIRICIKFSITSNSIFRYIRMQLSHYFADGSSQILGLEPRNLPILRHFSECVGFKT
jgi:hypothetical protein